MTPFPTERAVPLAAAPTAGLALTVNGQPAHTQAGTLQDWVQTQGLAPEAVATALNGRFVPREARAACLLQAGDAILSFQPIVGG